MPFFTKLKNNKHAFWKVSKQTKVMNNLQHKTRIMSLYLPQRRKSPCWPGWDPWQWPQVVAWWSPSKLGCHHNR